MKHKIILIIVLIFAVLQLFTPDKIYEAVDESNDFVSQVEGDEYTINLIKTVCYDCHSNQPNYPWYAGVAPLSFWIHDHIEHGREHLNFSIWNTYSEDKKAHKIEECWEEVEEGEMPLYSYTIMHQEAQLTDEQIEKVVQFFKAQAAK